MFINIVKFTNFSKDNNKRYLDIFDESVSDQHPILYFISDIDECASNSGLGPCEMSCNNTDGEFHCTCDDGYGLLPDTVSCQSKSSFMSIIVYPSQSLVAFIYIRFLCLPYINVQVVKGHKSPVITRTPTYMRVHSQQFLNHLKNF